MYKSETGNKDKGLKHHIATGCNVENFEVMFASLNHVYGLTEFVAMEKPRGAEGRGKGNRRSCDPNTAK